MTLNATDCQSGETLAREQAEATTQGRRPRRARARWRRRCGRGSANRCRRSSSSTCRSSRRPRRRCRRSRPTRSGSKSGGADASSSRSPSSIGRSKARSGVRGGLHDAVDRLRQPRRMAAQRRVRAARLRRQPAGQRARAAVHHLPVPRPRHRQSGRRRRDAGAVEGGVSARLPAGQRAGADLQPARPLRSGRRRSARGAAAQSRPRRSRCRTWRSPIAALGRYAEARKIAEQAVALGVATTPTRRLLYQLGRDGGRRIRRHAPRMGEEQAARVRPGLGAGAGRRRIGGRLREAAALYSSAADMATARSLAARRRATAAHLALTEALYGDPRRATDRVRDIVARTSAEPTRPGRCRGSVPRRRSAWSGLVAEAQATGGAAPSSDIRNRPSSAPCSVPSDARRRSRSDAARRPRRSRRCEPAAPTEFGTVAGLVPVLPARRSVSAQREDAAAVAASIRRCSIIAAVDPFAPVVPLARLGLARAWQLIRRSPTAAGAPTTSCSRSGRTPTGLPTARARARGARAAGSQHARQPTAR